MRDNPARAGFVMVNKPCELAVVGFHVCLASADGLPLEPEAAKIKRHFTLFCQVTFRCRILGHKDPHHAYSACRLGDNRDRFNSAEEIQNYAGITPVTERSGQKSWVHWRWQCAKFVRQTFVEWAAKTVNSSYWAKLYYQGMREKGKSHQSAIRALAFKWIRIIYRCWKTRTRYDEAKYLLALEARKSPLLMP